MNRRTKPWPMVHEPSRRTRGQGSTTSLEWLQERDDPRVVRYLQAENDYCEAHFADLVGLQDEIYEEICSRYPMEDVSVPVRQGHYVYYKRQERGEDYLIHCRRADRPGAVEVVVLDENKLAEDHDYCAVRALSVSPDHRFLAYSVDFRGDERHELRLCNLNEGSMVCCREDVGVDLVWAQNSRNLLYTVLDDSNRPCKAYVCRVGGSAAPDVLLHQEEDEDFSLHLAKTESGDYITIVSKSLNTTEVRILDASLLSLKPWVMHPKRSGARCAVTHHRDHFYILTNEGASGFKVMRSQIMTRHRRSWETFVPHRKEVQLERMCAFADHLVLFGRQDGRRRVWVRSMLGNSLGWEEVELPEDVVVYPEDSGEFKTSKLRLGLCSLAKPYSIFEFDMDTHHLELKKEAKVLGGFNKDDYVSRRLSASAPDAASIPISMVYRKDCDLEGGNPLVLYAYGAYGYCTEPEFDPARLCLLDRGVVFAIAHVRGGGELGEEWHEQGRLLAKKNTFRDFIACAEYLIEAGFTNREQLAIWGESAGGLLVGAVLNQRADLFAAVIADCPFVDVLNTLMDPTLPLSVSDWQEFGDPRIKDDYEYIRSYSPYENVREQAYPPIYATAGLNDPRVPYWGPVKWINRLREQTTSEYPALLELDSESGHWGSSGRLGYLEEITRKYATLLSWLK